MGKRHWQMLAIRARRMRRAAPSVSMVVFVIAIMTIVFFSDLQFSSLASQTSHLVTQEVLDTQHAMPRLDIQADDTRRIPPSVESDKDSIGSKAALASDDPLVVSIEKLRRDFAENYKTE
jgi:hypothetical protein